MEEPRRIFEGLLNYLGERRLKKLGCGKRKKGKTMEGKARENQAFQYSGKKKGPLEEIEKPGGEGRGVSSSEKGRSLSLLGNQNPGPRGGGRFKEHKGEKTTGAQRWLQPVRVSSGSTSAVFRSRKAELINNKEGKKISVGKREAWRIAPAARIRNRKLQPII